MNLAGAGGHRGGQPAAVEEAGQPDPAASASFSSWCCCCVIFRALLAPFVTLLPAALRLALSGSFIGALGAHGLKISFFTQILLIVLLLGRGPTTGCSWSSGCARRSSTGASRTSAVAHALARVGESITASAATVIVALLTLILASFGIYHDLGVPLAIGVVVMLLAGLTLLPALLAIFGRAVFWPSKTAPRASTARDLGAHRRAAGAAAGARPRASAWWSSASLALVRARLQVRRLRRRGHGARRDQRGQGERRAGRALPAVERQPDQRVMRFATPVLDQTRPVSATATAGSRTTASSPRSPARSTPTGPP